MDHLRNMQFSTALLLDIARRVADQTPADSVDIAYAHIHAAGSNVRTRDVMETLPDDMRYYPNEPATIARAREIVAIADELGPRLLDTLQRCFPDAVRHGLDVADMAANLDALRCLLRPDPEREAADLATAKVALKRGSYLGAQEFLENSHGRSSPAVRVAIVEAMVTSTDPRVAGAAVKELGSNPAFNTAEVQAALLVAYERLLGVPTQVALREDVLDLLVATARSGAGISADLSHAPSVLGLPSPLSDVKALLGVLSTRKPTQPAPEAMAGALRAVGSRESRDEGLDIVVNEVLDKAADMPRHPSVEAALAGLVIAYGLNVYRSDVLATRAKALGLFERMSKHDGPGAQAMHVIWDRIAHDASDDLVMSAIRLVDGDTPIAPEHRQYADLAALRLALHPPGRRDEDLPYMLRIVLGQVGYHTPAAITDLAATLRGVHFAPIKSVPIVEEFVYRGLWQDKGSVAVRTDAVTGLAPAHPTPGYWNRSLVAGALEKLEAEPQLDALAHLLLAYGLVGTDAAVAQRCRALLARDGEISPFVASFILTQTLTSLDGMFAEPRRTNDRLDTITWACDFLLRQPIDGALASSAGQVLVGYIHQLRAKGFVDSLITRVERLAEHLGVSPKEPVKFEDEAYLRHQLTRRPAERETSAGLAELATRPVSIAMRRSLAAFIGENARTTETGVLRNIRAAAGILSQTPELNPQEVQETLYAAVVSGTSPLVVSQALDVLLQQVDTTGRLDMWATNRIPELTGRLADLQSVGGDWFEVRSKARSLLYALDVRSADDGPSGMGDDAARDYIGRCHGRSRAALTACLETLTFMEESAARNPPLRADFAFPVALASEGAFIIDPNATTVPASQLHRDVSRKLRLIRALLAESATWSHSTPEAVRATSLSPTTDVVDLGNAGYIVAYPSQRWLVADGRVAAVADRDVWELVRNSRLSAIDGGG